MVRSHILGVIILSTSIIYIYGSEYLMFPLSLLLFTLVANSLSQIIINAESKSLSKGFKVGSDKVNVSHL